MVGIVGYGAWIPYTRIDVKEIHRVWRNVQLPHISDDLQLTERAVLQPNEDVVTLAVGAAERALEHGGVALNQIEAALLGTGTNPYDTRPSVTIICEALGVPYGVFSADVQFAGKSGTTAIQLGLAMVKSSMAATALCIGSDAINRHSCPGRIAEYSGSAAAVAVILGNNNAVAEIRATTSYASDLSDGFRVEGERYIQDIGEAGKIYPAFEIGMVHHISHAAEALTKQTGLSPADYDHVVFQQPNGGVPRILADRLGFTPDQLAAGLVASAIGDCGSASALLGLANILDRAHANQKILVVSYGFGAGADALCIETTPLIEERRPRHPVEHLLAHKSLVDYATASRLEYKYAQDTSPLHL